MRDEVEAALERIRPALHMDGGDVELVDVDEGNGIVTITLIGNCGGCPMSMMTLKMGIERTLRESVPAVTEVVAV